MFDGLNWSALLVALAIVELTPGPNMGWLATLSARAGFKAGLRAVLGVTLGLALQVVAAIIGLSAVLASSLVLYEALRWAGVAFMVYLAWESWTESRDPAPAQVAGYGNFKHGLIANLLNPKALIFYIAVVGQFADPVRGSLELQILVLGAIHIAMATLVHLAIIALGTRLGVALERWRTSLPVRVSFAIALLLIAVWLAVSTSR